METLIEQTVRARFPGVQDFRIDQMPHNVQAVEYLDAKGNRRHEIPPVVRWRVGDQRFAYVLNPKFRVERWRVAFFFESATTRADYTAEQERLWDILQWSVDGQSVEEINRLL